MGSHVFRCPDGHGEIDVYSSCGHRACPGCSGGRRARWFEEESARVLGGPHFHVIFTLPFELRDLWRHNRVRLPDLLLRAAAETMLGLLRDPRWMGGTPGVIAVLHTWGSSLIFHPHVHLVVSSVGLGPMGKLVHAKRPFLVPYDVIRTVFRGRFYDGLTGMLARKEIYLPRGARRADLRRTIERLWRLPRRAVNVCVLRRDDVRPVLKYLAKTISGGPLSDARILRVEDGVVELATESTRGAPPGTPPTPTTVRLEIAELVARWMEHIPEAHMKTVRHYGLYSGRMRPELVLARKLLGDAALPVVVREHGSGRRADLAIASPSCPVCRREMEVVRRVARGTHIIVEIEEGLARARDAPERACA
jgi:hypothetical protein